MVVHGKSASRTLRSLRSLRAPAGLRPAGACASLEKIFQTKVLISEAKKDKEARKSEKAKKA